MFVLGLTGSIGMGKSTAARNFRRLGVPVFDADQTVSRLMAKGGKAVTPVGSAFPEARSNGEIDHDALAARVFSDGAALRRLEGILHPMVREERCAFLRKWRLQRRRLVVLDVPLLYETGGERFCDGVAVVSAPFYVQRRRVLARPGMSEERFRAILRRQTPDREKRRRADFIISTGLSRGESLRAIRKIVRKISRVRPH